MWFLVSLNKEFQLGEATRGEECQYCQHDSASLLLVLTVANSHFFQDFQLEPCKSDLARSLQWAWPKSYLLIAALARYFEDRILGCLSVQAAAGLHFRQLTWEQEVYRAIAEKDAIRI